jgi:excisionase family DNA binding protein
MQPSPSDPLQLMTVKQAAELLQVSTRTVRRLIETNALKPIRIGRAIRVQRLQVEHLISSST